MNSRSIWWHVLCASQHSENCPPPDARAGTWTFRCRCLDACGDTQSTNLAYIFKIRSLSFLLLFFVHIFLPGFTKSGAMVYAAIHLLSTAQETVLHENIGRYWGSCYILGKLKSFACNVEILRWSHGNIVNTRNVAVRMAFIVKADMLRLGSLMAFEPSVICTAAFFFLTALEYYNPRTLANYCYMVRSWHFPGNVQQSGKYKSFREMTGTAEATTYFYGP